jgi:hypothetical protein
MSLVPKAEPDEALPAEPARRLCSEIQLFDLCELERCHFKDGRFCTDPDMLARFEAAAEPEDRPVWHFDRASEDEEEGGPSYEGDLDSDDDDYSVFDDEDRPEQDENW